MPPEVRDAVAFTIEQMSAEVEHWRRAFRVILGIACGLVFWLIALTGRCG